jgi:hypothetical protein
MNLLAIPQFCPSSWHRAKIQFQSDRERLCLLESTTTTYTHERNSFYRYAPIFETEIESDSALSAKNS